MFGDTPPAHNKASGLSLVLIGLSTDTRSSPIPLPLCGPIYVMFYIFSK